jgi:hypothetical protein
MEEVKRGRWEARSVAGYRRTLDVLAGLGDDERGAERDAGRARARRSDPAPGEGSGAGQGTSGTSGTSGTWHGAGQGTSHGRSSIPSLVAMERPARRGMSIGALVAVLVLVVAGVGVFLAVRPHHGTSLPKKPARSRSHASSAPTTPTTTLPSRYTAVSATGSSATYTPSSAPGTGSYSLLVGATTSNCWMSVTSATGKTVLAQTFTPGATASVSLTGRSTIVIGAPGAAKLAIGGVPLVLPSGATSPFTVTLVPA